MRFLAGGLALGLVAAGCGDDDDGGGTEDAATTATTAATVTSSSGSEEEVCTEERVGGSLTMSALSMGPSLDPYGVGGGAANTALEYIPLYDSLLRFDEETGEFVGQLAESIEPNEDSSEWTLTLREGITFGNGDPFDAEAVKASTERYIDPAGTSRMRSVGQYIERIEVVDPLTVKYVLTGPFGYFPVHLSAGGGAVGALGIVPNVKLIEERGVDAFGQDSTGGGAGPYEVKEWNPPERIVLEAKDDWWGGPVCIEELTFISTANGQLRLEALETGELDMAVQFRDPVPRAESIDAFDSYTTLSVAGNQLELNQAHPELADVRVRQAIAAAIDPEIINERAFGGQALAWTGLVPEEANVLEPTEGPSFDLDRAKELVAEVKAEGMALEFELLAAEISANVEAALATEAMLEAAGFSITLRTLPLERLVGSIYAERDFELGFGGQGGSEVGLVASLARFVSNSPINASSFHDAAFDSLHADLQRAGSVDELQRVTDAIQARWNEVIPSVVLFSDEVTWVWNVDVRGMTFTRNATPYFDTAYLGG